MLDKHPCLVPNSWAKYPSDFIGLVLHSEIKAHYRKTNEIEGTRIQIDNSRAVLCIHDKQMCMRNEKDLHRKLRPQEYTKVFMPYINTTESRNPCCRYI